MSYQEKRISCGDNVIVLFDWFSPYKAKEGWEGWEGWETMGNNAFLSFRFSTTAKAGSLNLQRARSMDICSQLLSIPMQLKEAGDCFMNTNLQDG